MRILDLQSLKFQKSQEDEIRKNEDELRKMKGGNEILRIEEKMRNFEKQMKVKDDIIMT